MLLISTQHLHHRHRFPRSLQRPALQRCRAVYKHSIIRQDSFPHEIRQPFDHSQIIAYPCSRFLAIGSFRSVMTASGSGDRRTASLSRSWIIRFHNRYMHPIDRLSALRNGAEIWKDLRTRLTNLFSKTHEIQ